MKALQWKVLLLAALAGSPMLTGCVSQAGLRQSIADREAEIRDLREERAALKGQVATLRTQLQKAEATASEASLSASLDRVEAQIPAAATAQTERAFPELDSLGIGYGLRDGQMVISIPSEITFGSGRADLSDQGKAALAKVASTLEREYPRGKYFVEGHTDTDPIKKSKFASNRELSLARAMAVLTFLVEQCQVPDANCTVVGHGQYEPVAAGSSTADKAKNRRVEIVVDTSGR
jgi:chemotaxis protein MotB